MRRPLAVLTALLIGAAAHPELCRRARADEKESATKPATKDRPVIPARAIGFSSTYGVTGMRNMIDARVPENFDLRGLIRFDHQSNNSENSFLKSSIDIYAGDLILGGSALGIIDAGLRIPFEYRKDKNRVSGISFDRDEEGVGAINVAGKAGIRLGPFALAPYVFGEIGSDNDLDTVDELDVGGAATFSILEERLAVHANLTGIYVGGGRYFFRYRGGVSVVPLADPLLLLRAYTYLDGLESEGSRGSDVRVIAGVQVLLFELLTADLGVEYKVYDGDLRGGRLRLRDDGTYSIHFGVGVSFGF